MLVCQVQVTTIASLDMDLVSTMPLMQTVDNYQQQHKINLKLLTKALNSTKMISEADEPWTHLFSEVKSEMQTERETRVSFLSEELPTDPDTNNVMIRDRTPLRMQRKKTFLTCPPFNPFHSPFCD